MSEKTNDFLVRAFFSLLMGGTMCLGAWAPLSIEGPTTENVVISGFFMVVNALGQLIIWKAP